jgi:hypothetical protein
MLMYLSFSNLNSVHWIIKKDIGLYKKFHYNVLKIDMKCPEKYIKAYIFFIIKWIEFKFEYLKYMTCHDNFQVKLFSPKKKLF